MNELNQLNSSNETVAVSQSPTWQATQSPVSCSQIYLVTQKEIIISVSIVTVLVIVIIMLLLTCSAFFSGNARERRSTPCPRLCSLV